MALYKIFHFFLNKEEETECRRRNIPNYYWYYLQAEEKGLALKEIKELIGSRIKKSLLSGEEIKTLISGVIRLIREFVKNYHNDKGMNARELEKIFGDKISELYNNIRIKRRKKKNIRKVFCIISETDKEELRPILIFHSQAAKDKYCLYYDECLALSKEHKARLDCRYCPHQNIKN